MALNIDSIFEGNLTCAFKNDMKIFANSHHSMFESVKIGTLMGSFYPIKFMSSNFTGKICVMAMKNDPRI